MVLPVWIEHTTSPLPRECSTTELRQQTERYSDDATHRSRDGGGRYSRPQIVSNRSAATLPQALGVGKRVSGVVGDGTLWRHSMATKGDDGSKSGSRQEQRAVRLEQELRANLKKRKDQARARSAESPIGGASLDAEGVTQPKTTDGTSKA